MEIVSHECDLDLLNYSTVVSQEDLAGIDSRHTKDDTYQTPSQMLIHPSDYITLTLELLRTKRSKKRVGCVLSGMPGH